MSGELWPFPPRAEFAETLSFMTEVKKTPSSESRVSFRNGRTRYDLVHFLDDLENCRAEKLFQSSYQLNDSAGSIAEWRVPAWSEGVEYDAPISVGVNSLVVGDHSDWREGGEVFVWSHLGEYDVVGIVSVVGGVLTLSRPTLVPCLFAYPVRCCYAVSTLSGARYFRGLISRNISFLTRDNKDLGGHDFPLYRGEVVLLDPPMVSSPYELDLGLDVDVFDNGAGPLVVEPYRSFFERKANITFIDVGVGAKWRRKRLIHYLRGKDTPFWMPSWSGDLLAADGVSAGQAHLDIQPIDGIDAADLVGSHIVIEAGSQDFRLVDGVSVQSSGVWRVSIEPVSFGATSDALRLGGLHRFRLDSDEVQMFHTGHAYMTTTLPLVGLPE